MTAISWKSALSGIWTTAADWSTGTVPTSADAVTIGIAGAYTVSVTATKQSVASLAISDFDATLAVTATGSTGSTLAVTGALSNAGMIALTGATAAAALDVTGTLSNTGSMSLTGKATLASGAFANRGTVAIDAAPGDVGGGGATLGVLTNSGDFDIGNGSLASALTVTASGLTNGANGTIDLAGGSAQAALEISAAAPTTWTGFAFLDGDTLLQFSSGGITGIAFNSELSLDGVQARVALLATPGSNSALTALATNNGTLVIDNGATVATIVALANAGTLDVDGGSRLSLGGALNNRGDAYVDGGGWLVIAGALNNTGYLSIGDSGLTQTTAVTATGFTNTGSLYVSGLAARATLDITGAAPTTISSSWDVSGDGVVEFRSGGITTIAQTGRLTLDGPRAHVSLSSDTSVNGALTTLASNAGFFSLDDGVLVNLAGAFSNSGTTDIDSFDAGGSTLALTGTLTNSSNLTIGNAGILGATTVTAAGLANIGTIDLAGGTAQAKLAVSGAAPATWTGTGSLTGNAMLDYGSGAITMIGSGASLSLNGALARVDIGTTLGNSALKTLAGNSGTFSLANGAVLATTVAFGNSASLQVDYNYGSTGGSSLTVGGTLTNSSFLDIGNANLTAATTVTAAGLTNSGTINLTGGAAQAKLMITSVAPATWTGTGSLTGNAMLDYASGAITAIGSGANLSLSGALARVDIGTTLGNSALKTLASNAGTFSLANGAALTTTVGLGNSGSVDVDSGYNNVGGSGLTIGGTLTTSGFLDIGNTNLTAATTVTAAALVNTDSITLNGGAAHATLYITGNASSSGYFYIDQSGAGGGVFTVVGTLTNSSSLYIGNSNLTRATTVTAAGLANTGTLNLTGGTAQAKLMVSGAAPATSTGTISLSGNAVLDYGSGAITAIGSGANLSLNGALALVDIGTTPGNSALTTLASNAGTFSLADGATLTTTGGFGNSGSVDVDSNYNNTGGSSLTVGGTLTNSGSFYIGNTSISAATTVSAAQLSNTNTINITGGSAQAKLMVSGAAPATSTGTISLSGNALLDYGSGTITAIGSGASLSLNGALALVDFGTTPGNSALTTLTSNAGTFSLADGATLTTTGGFGNSGSVDVDSNYNNTGGSSLTVGGTLTNSSYGLFIGNTSISAATTVTATTLVNTDYIAVVGGTAHATLHITGNASSSGYFYIDQSTAGGGIVTVGGTLTNSNSLYIGNSSLSRVTTVTAAALANTGTINIAGGTAQAKLAVSGAAPATWTGTALLTGNALLDYGSGGITAIGSGASLSLNGALALVDIGTTLGNSALTTLASNAGTFSLADGATLTTTVGFSNSSSLDVDSNYNNTGGSSLTVGGTLTNSGYFYIGNTGITAAVTVKVTALTNNSFDVVQITGNAAGSKAATLHLTAASTDAGSITIGGGGVLALGGSLTVTGSVNFTGGTITGGALTGAGTISDSYGTGTLSSLTIEAGATVSVSSGTLVVSGVTVGGAINGENSSTLTFGKAGTDTMTRISGFPTIDLANGGANTLTLASANFTGVTADIITVNDGNSGNTVTASSLTATDAIAVHAGSGADALTGGAGNDVFYAGGKTTMTGKLGANQFTFAATGSNSITDFAASASNELVLSNSGFNLGTDQGLGTGTPQHLDTGVFSTQTNGTFDNAIERFAYNTMTGVLNYGADGNGGSSFAIVTLTDHASLSAGAAGNLYFVS